MSRSSSGTLLAIGDVASLGLDSQHGVELGVDYLDGTFDGTPGQLQGHDVTLRTRTTAARRKAGRPARRRSPPTDADRRRDRHQLLESRARSRGQILADKGIMLISPSNTNPG